MFLWCMGVNLEYRWGWPAFACLYLVGGVAASATFAGFHPGSTVPIVGASGAIAASMGAFLIALHKTRIRFWYWYFLIFKAGAGTFQAPAWVVLPLWFLFDAAGAYGEWRGAASGVAYSAHVGGFLFGLLIALGLKLSGIEKKLLEAAGTDVFDDPTKWQHTAPDTTAISAQQRGSPIQQSGSPIQQSGSPIQQSGSPIQQSGSVNQRSGSVRPESIEPPVKKTPGRCPGCGLINMPGVQQCRRCDEAL